MKLIIQGTALGELPHYISAARAAHAPTIGELLKDLGDDARAIDAVGLRNYFDCRPDGKKTCFLAAELLPAGSDLYGDDTHLHCTSRALPRPSGPLFPLLENVVKELLAQTTRIAVALSGGLDSALVLALAHRATQALNTSHHARYRPAPATLNWNKPWTPPGCSGPIHRKLSEYAKPN